MPRHRRRRDAGGVVDEQADPQSLGYDKVRFLGPVYIGDTLTLTYTISEIDLAKRRSRSDIKVVNQKGELVGVAQHILAWVKDKA